jgi:hypothetical protein
MTTRRSWTLRIWRTGLLAALVAACVGVFGGSAGATNGSVIIVSDTVVGSTMDNPAPVGAGEGLAPSVSWEAYGAILNGKHVVVKTAAQVAGMPPATSRPMTRSSSAIASVRQTRTSWRHSSGPPRVPRNGRPRSPET